MQRRARRTFNSPGWLFSMVFFFFFVYKRICEIRHFYFVHKLQTRTMKSVYTIQTRWNPILAITSPRREQC